LRKKKEERGKKKRREKREENKSQANPKLEQLAVWEESWWCSGGRKLLIYDAMKTLTKSTLSTLIVAGKIEQSSQIIFYYKRFAMQS
jgi:hypothetical protein